MSLDPLLDIGGCPDPHSKVDVEIACRLDAQILLLAHVEGPVKASPHQKEQGIGTAKTGKEALQKIAFSETVKYLEKKETNISFTWMKENEKPKKTLPL